MFGRNKEAPSAAQVDEQLGDPLAEIPKSRWERMWPILACGSGLFSDGYINNVSYPLRHFPRLSDILWVIGSVSTMLSTIYGKEYTGSSAQANISAVNFAGTVLGLLVFGYMSDKWSRKNPLVVSTIILIVFAALGAGAFGAGGSTQGNVRSAHRISVPCWNWNWNWWRTSSWKYGVESDVAIECISSSRSISVYSVVSKECRIYLIRRIDRIECFT
jgi:hypothetical protein